MPVASVSRPIAFLSYSSENRPLVEAVHKAMTLGSAFLDVSSFEDGRLLVDEIGRALESCTLYCLFFSKAARASSWVQDEMRAVVRRLEEDSSLAVMIFTVDGAVSVTDLPDRLRSYIVSGASSPSLIHRKVIDRLASQGQDDFGWLPKIFIGESRDREIIRLKRRFTDVESRADTIYCYGSRGLGRKTLIKQFLSAWDGGRNPTLLTIFLERFDSDHELFRRLIRITLNADELPQNVLSLTEEFASGNDAVRNHLFRTQLKQLRKAKTKVIVEADECLVDESGTAAPWLSCFVDCVSNEAPGHVHFVSRRRPNHAFFDSAPTCEPVKINPITTEESQRLLSELLRRENVSSEYSLTVRAAEAFGGNPSLIELLVRRSVDSSILDSDAIDHVSRSAIATYSNLLAGSKLSDTDKLAIALFYDLRTLSVRDLSTLLEIGASDAQVSIGGLYKLGLIYPEFDAIAGDTTRLVLWSLPGYLQLSVLEVVNREWTTIPGFENRLLLARRRFVDYLNSFDEASIVEHGLVERVGICSDLLVGDEHQLRPGLQQLLLPAQRVNSAHKLYQLGDYAGAVTLFDIALQRQSLLSTEAKVGAARLAALASVRLGREPDFKKFLNILQREHDAAVAKHRPGYVQHIAFVRGFNARWMADYDDAHEFLYTAYRVTKSHRRASELLRELATVNMMRYEHEAALNFARECLERTRGDNPFALDIAIRCLIEAVHHGVINHDAARDELNSMFTALERVSVGKVKGLLFTCKARYALRLDKDLDAAIEYFLTAQEFMPSVKTDLEIAQLRFWNLDTETAESDLQNARRIIQSGQTEHSQLWAHWNRVRVVGYLAQSDWSAASRHLMRPEVRLPKSVRTQLERDVEFMKAGHGADLAGVMGPLTG